MDEPTTHTSDDILTFEFACPRCGAAVALAGRVVLTPDRRHVGIVCPACGNESYLAILPPEA